MSCMPRTDFFFPYFFLVISHLLFLSQIHAAEAPIPVAVQGLNETNNALIAIAGKAEVITGTIVAAQESLSQIGVSSEPIGQLVEFIVNNPTTTFFYAAGIIAVGYAGGRVLYRVGSWSWKKFSRSCKTCLCSPVVPACNLEGPYQVVVDE